MSVGIVFKVHVLEFTVTNVTNNKVIYKTSDRVSYQVVVGQLQQELADSLTKQSLSEALLELMSPDHAKLEDETQDLKKKLRQITSRVCMRLLNVNEDIKCFRILIPMDSFLLYFLYNYFISILLS